eukprot:2868947-Pyramimonas_sp.AAC.1
MMTTMGMMMLIMVLMSMLLLMVRMDLLLMMDGIDYDDDGDEDDEKSLRTHEDDDGGVLMMASLTHTHGLQHILCFELTLQNKRPTHAAPDSVVVHTLAPLNHVEPDSDPAKCKGGENLRSKATALTTPR